MTKANRPPGRRILATSSSALVLSGRFEASLRELCSVAHSERQRVVDGALDRDARQVTTDETSVVLSGDPETGTRRAARQIDKGLACGQVQAVSESAQFAQRNEADVGEVVRKVFAGHMLSPDSSPRRATTPC